MFPKAPLYIENNLEKRSQLYQKRRQWLMDKSSGPVVLISPAKGPNQDYAWAHCFQPVFQDSYILFLTGINQTGISFIFDPKTKKEYIFLPDYNSEDVFWNGQTFSFGNEESYSFLKKNGFSDIHSIHDFKTILLSLNRSSLNWHLLLEKTGKKFRRNESYFLKKYLRRQFTQSFQHTNISDLSWEHRLIHDALDVGALTVGLQKTCAAFQKTICDSFNSEQSLSGQLIGNLLKETPYGLAFPPIIARNENAAILHYTDNSVGFQKNDLILMDFGLRWESMCSDISRTIPYGGKYTDLQKRLVSIVLDVQIETIQQVKAGITFNQLNTFAWSLLEKSLETNFTNKGGKMRRLYKKQPHNIGHLLGIQVHDGDANRDYRKDALPAHSIITIEPGLYGAFELNGEAIECGIRIEDNILVTSDGHVNLSVAIPKSCDDIEALMKRSD